MTTTEDHLDAINAALITGEYARIDQHVKAVRKTLDESNRWDRFTDRELDHTWQHLITPFVDPAFESLVAELEAEQTRRRDA